MIDEFSLTQTPTEPLKRKVEVIVWNESYELCSSLGCEIASEECLEDTRLK